MSDTSTDQPCPVCLYHWNQTVLPGDAHNYNCPHYQQPQPPQPEAPERSITTRCPFHAPESNLCEVAGEWYSNQRIAYWAVFCEACGARGPEAQTKAEAIEAWNVRADLAAERPAGQRRIDIALGYIKQAASREFEPYPCPVSEMTERELAIAKITSDAVGRLLFIQREIQALETRGDIAGRSADEERVKETIAWQGTTGLSKDGLIAIYFVSRIVNGKREEYRDKRNHLVTFDSLTNAQAKADKFNMALLDHQRVQED